MLRVAEHLVGRMQQVMQAMIAVRAHRWAAAGEDGPAPTGPPTFIVDANRELLERLTGLFEQHRDELRIPPETAAWCCAASSSAPGTRARRRTRLTPEEIVDVILDGVTRQRSDR